MNSQLIEADCIDESLTRILEYPLIYLFELNAQVLLDFVQEFLRELEDVRRHQWTNAVEIEMVHVIQ